ncbi:MAG TPA: thiamine pyrophosphate-binding protein [Solirubrobacteraceae bacterium]|jgi:thiamine pyrophosphate-dependent acetolactate synthase large subunit-like protein
MSPRPGSWVSDAVVDVLVEAGIEHAAFNPGASFRGLHDSLVHHREDGPAPLLCLHEGVAVAVAHGYAKACGRPMAAIVHDVVGLQHASMAIYNAWCDRVPMLVLGGTGPVSTVHRRPWIDWIHTALVQGNQVRDYVKWDDQPADAASIPRSLARALTLTRSAPPGPVYVCLDAGLQEEPLPGAFEWEGMAAHPVPAAAAPGPDDVRAMAALLREAERPLIATDFAGDDPEAFAALVELAEATGAGVLDCGARLNFPTSHPLNVTYEPDAVRHADAVLGIDVDDFAGALQRTGARRAIHAGVGHLRVRGWSNDFQELPALERHVTAAAAPAIAALTAAFRAEPLAEEVGAERRSRHPSEPGARLADARAAALRETADGAVPVPRLLAELWPVLRDRAVTVVHGEPPPWGHERRLWALDEPRSHLGSAAGGGLGDGPGHAIGAALALHGSGRLCLNLQPDGDLLFTPSALWTAVHARLPLLTVVLDNREYRNTVDHAQRIAEARDRPPGRRRVGAVIDDPPIAHADLARSMGMWAIGPLTDPAQLRTALDEALAEIDAGRPALIHVLTPRG